jgi:hypothetical protein
VTKDTREEFKIRLDTESGWMWYHHADESKSPVRLSWLPDDMRGYAYSSYGSIFAVGSSHDGHMTILDFKDTIRVLREAGALA